MPPFFTIITASLNNAVTIRHTLESIKGQNYKNYEHIVSDGGSVDNSTNIFSEYELIYNLQWNSEPDQGISDALNKGLLLAHGRYIIVIQADDQFLNTDILKNVYPLLKKEEFDVGCFPVIVDHPVKGKILRKPIKNIWWNHFKFIFPHQGCFVHRRVFEKIGGFRNEFKIAMDYDFFYRAIDCHLSILFGKFPVALMGGDGVGTSLKFLDKRLLEEKLVHIRNEQNHIWKFAQFLFRIFYLPYKRHNIRSRLDIR